jgi:7-cyano-7-deazaguanine synthase
VPKQKWPRGFTYVPCRNLLFLSYAVAWAEAIGTAHVFIGVNALDYSGYPDCRPEFIAVFETLATIGTKAGQEGARFNVHAPLLRMTKKDIVQRAVELEVDLSLTHSCYDPTPDGRACGQCDSCQLRRKGFREAGVEDPIAYAS